MPGPESSRRGRQDMTGFGRRRVFAAVLLVAAALVTPLAGPALTASAATDVTFVGAQPL